MDYRLIAFMIVIIPVAAILDYFAFRKRFERQGIPISWRYFVLPCAIECGMFIVGYLIGSGGV
jgi:hypothetical protein